MGWMKNICYAAENGYNIDEEMFYAAENGYMDIVKLCIELLGFEAIHDEYINIIIRGTT